LKLPSPAMTLPEVYMRCATLRLGLLALALASVAGLCRAGATDEVTRIFDLVDTPPPKGKSRLSIQQELTKAAPDAGADYRVRLAYVYALIHEKKYPDALAVVTKVAAEQPDNVAAHQAKAWLLFVSRKPTDALVELESIAKALATTAKSPAAEEERFEAAQFLGTALAYCDGPGAALVKKPAVAQVKSRVLKSLSTTQRAAFDEQAAAVAEQYAELQGKGKEAAEEAKAKKEAADKVAAEKQAEVDKAAAAAKVESDKVAAELKKKYDQLTGEYGRLSESHNQMLVEMAAARTSLANAQSQLASLSQPRPDRNGNVSSADQNAYNRQAGRLNSSINNLTTTVTRLATSLDQSAARGRSLENQVSQLVREGEKVGAHFAELNQTLGKKKAKVARQKSSVAKMPTGKPAALGQRETAFVTYADFPYETAKQRLLAALAAE
jgi:hypothetical protein